MSLRQTQLEAIELLKELIKRPSVSGEEGATAQLLDNFFKKHAVPTQRLGNNVVAFGGNQSADGPTVMLCSHHDTVPPSKSYTRDPFHPTVEDGRLYGLGSNDAGGCLVSYIAAFLHLTKSAPTLPYRLILAATAEEEVSGKNGIAALLPHLPTIDFCLVGEPTGMAAAVAEKGLVVLDCVARGRAGHAARNEGDNAIDVALKDIAWLHEFRFPKESHVLGPVKMTATVIAAGSSHNVIPDRCDFVVDVRTTDAYSNEETVAIIKDHLKSEVIPRSTRLQPSSIPMDHPFVRTAQELGVETYGSPTLSDQALMAIPSMKIGPGQSSRSHQADEYVLLSEVEAGISRLVELLTSVDSHQLIRKEHP